MNKDKMISEVLGSEKVLAPSEIVNTEFRRTFFGGYDPREVDRYLSRIADVMEMMARQMRELKSELEDQRAKVEEYRQVEETLRNALVTSQKFSENLIESTKREAQLLLDAARVDCKRMQQEAARLPVALSMEIARLQEQRDRLRAEISAVLAAHRDLLDSLQPAEQFGPSGLGLQGPDHPPQEERKATFPPARETEQEKSP